MACEPETDLENAGQFSSIIPPGLHAAVQSYLLAKIRGGSMDVNEIMQEAKCYSHCIPPRLMPRIKTWLLCQLSNTGGETPIPPSPECDADAQAFITAAGLTPGSLEAGAVCVLVRDLKAYPTVGTKYWDRDILIYPMVGGTAASNAVNLKNPLGANDLTYVGAGLIHSANGIQGNLSSYARTNYVIPGAMQDSIRAMAYIDIGISINVRSYFGCSTSGAGTPFFSLRREDPYFRYHVNNTSTLSSGLSPTLGAVFIQRRIAASQMLSAPNSPNWVTNAAVSVGTPNSYVLLFALNNGVGPPVGAGTSISDCRMSGFSLGTPLDSGVGVAEKNEYKYIWDKFNNTLGRGHP